MAADPIIFCLKELTDYDQFEHLCHDLMALEGYPNIEPLGGSKDKGRDAIDVSRNGKRTSIFAYSVREDWLKKLKEDAGKIKKYGHVCNQLVFLVTEKITATERDNAIKLVQKQFGWKLKIYHLARLRVLVVKHRHLLPHHPQIFTPAIMQGFTARFDQKTNDHLFVSYAKDDEALATWLTRKLTAEGYRVWCQHISLLGEDEYPADVEEAIRTRTFSMLALYSRASLADQDVMLQRAIAHGLSAERGQEALIPLEVEELDERQLDSRTRRLTSIPFYESWATGLSLLLKKLRSIDCPKPLKEGPAIAASSFLGDDVLGGPETLYSNCLPVKQVPNAIYRFEARRPITDDQAEEMHIRWAFRKASDTLLLAFHKPPEDIAAEHGLQSAGGISWRDFREIGSIRCLDVATELIRKSLLVKCHERGLEMCRLTWLRYFAPGLLEGDRLWYVRADGKKNFIASAGQRKYWSPSVSEEYRYHLSPVFTVRRDMGRDFTVLVKVRVKFADVNGEPLPGKKVPSRRKHLCKDWWNDDWLNRTLAICQYLADGSETITVGDAPGVPPEEHLIVEAMPLHWTVPVSIDERALGESSYDRSEFEDDEGWSDEEDEVPEESRAANG
jgi:hypothetical protein